MTLRSGGDARHSCTTNRLQLTSMPRAALSSAVSCKPAFTAFCASLLDLPLKVTLSLEHLHDACIRTPAT